MLNYNFIAKYSGSSITFSEQMTAGMEEFFSNFGHQELFGFWDIFLSNNYY